MTFGVVAAEEPLVAELIALAFESAGHVGIVFQDLAHATRILQDFHVDSIVLDLHMPDGSGLDWVETLATEWPDLPSRTLLLTRTPLTTDETTRVRALGVEVAQRPFSLFAVERIVTGHLRYAGGEKSEWGREAPASFAN